MRWLGIFLITVSLLVQAQLPRTTMTFQYQSCPQTSYFCLDPKGTEFGIVGPVNMWYNPDERQCIPSPRSRNDACNLITKLCNDTYPSRCEGDCLGGHSVTYSLERSCSGVTPISPDTSEPDVRHELWFIK